MVNKVKKIVFIGYVVTPEEANVMSGVSIAGNKMQWNIIKHLSENKDYDVECITITPYAPFPKDRKALIPKKKVAYFDGRVKCTRPSYINLPIIKQIHQIFSVYFAAKKVMKKNPDSVIFTFNMFPQVGIPARKLRKKFKKSDLVCLLADLPLDDYTNRRGFSKWLRSKFDKSTIKSILCVDRFVVLNKYVVETFAKNKPYIVVDGGIEESAIESAHYQPKERKEKNILFCGALTEYNGISNLLKAMEFVKYDEVCLDIYGGGFLKDEVIKAAENDSRIRFWGFVANTEVMQLQKEAWILINPRVVDDPISKVTFPSKTFEYLLSGTPVLSTRLNGYSEDYEGKIFFSKTDSPQDIADAINCLYETNEETLFETARSAFEYVVSEKSWKHQTERISDFIKSEML